MKKIATFFLATMLGMTVSVAGEMATAAPSCASTSYSKRVSVPTGAFFNGTDFVRVNSDWVKIVIDGQNKQYNIRNVEKDPYGNYVVALENGECITIYPNGRKLYYNDTLYSKKSLYD